VQGIFEGAFTSTPIAGWKGAVPQWIDGAGREGLVLGKDCLLIGHLKL